jgi:hypothetical protein
VRDLYEYDTASMVCKECGRDMGAVCLPPNHEHAHGASDGRVCTGEMVRAEPEDQLTAALAEIDSLRTRLQAAERERDEARESERQVRADLKCVGGYRKKAFADFISERAAHAETRARASEIKQDRDDAHQALTEAGVAVHDDHMHPQGTAGTERRLADRVGDVVVRAEAAEHDLAEARRERDLARSDLERELSRLTTAIQTMTDEHAETRRALEVERAVIAEIGALDVCEGGPAGGWNVDTLREAWWADEDPSDDFGGWLIAEARRRIAERAQKGVV